MLINRNQIHKTVQFGDSSHQRIAVMLGGNFLSRFSRRHRRALASRLFPAEPGRFLPESSGSGVCSLPAQRHRCGDEHAGHRIPRDDPHQTYTPAHLLPALPQAWSAQSVRALTCVSDTSESLRGGSLYFFPLCEASSDTVARHFFMSRN